MPITGALWTMTPRVLINKRSWLKRSPFSHFKHALVSFGNIHLAMNIKITLQLPGCPTPSVIGAGVEEDPDYPASNALADQCTASGSTEWRGVGNRSELVIVLGCKQDIKAFYIKNGEADHQTENFTISVGTHPKGPWKVVLEGSLNLTTSLVMIKKIIQCIQIFG